jgi:cytochrome c556
MIMKSLIQAVAIAALLAAPVASFAQSNQPVTRAQVRAELVQLEKAGYSPANGRDPYYPSDVQAAEARVAAQNATAQADTTGYGAGSNGSSQAGQRVEFRASSYSAPVYNAH